MLVSSKNISAVSTNRDRAKIRSVLYWRNVAEGVVGYGSPFMPAPLCSFPSLSCLANKSMKEKKKKGIHKRLSFVCY
jgi:hypothetical protein